MKHAPQFPPLLKGHRVPQGKNPTTQAIAMLKKNKLGAGDILWSEAESRLSFALVLEPDVARDRCGEMLHLLMVAFGDALGAISAPEIAINYRWPSTILVNEATVGAADLEIADDEVNGYPAWLVLSLDIAIRPEQRQIDPGLNADVTTIWDEGCGDISRTQLLESVSRHIANWIHNWNEDGFKSIHEQWTGRISEKQKIDAVLTQAEFVGLDECGNALLKEDGNVNSLATLDAVERLRMRG